MPFLRKKKQRKNDENYEREEFVIPTPSIDQVLQNLASNALEIASGEEGSKSDDEEQQDGERDESVAYRIEPDLRRSKRKQNLTTQTVTSTKIVTAPFISRNIAKPIAGLNTRMSNGRTISENGIAGSSSSSNSMLNELVSRSVKNKETSNVQQMKNGSINLNRPISSQAAIQPPKTIYSIPQPIGFSVAGTSAMSSHHQQIYRELNNFRDNYNQWPQNNRVDPRIESTVDQVVSSFCKSVRAQPTSSNVVQSSSSNSSYQQERPQHFVVRPMPTNALIGANNNNILTKKNNIIVNGQESQQQPITIDEEGEDNNDDVQIVDDEEGEEGECSPFCKNCASEIPLIIKRLDQLDNMVNRMVKMVKKELGSSNQNINHF